MSRKIEFDELGQEYRRKFYSRADYLIERGYVTDADRDELAKKVYDAFMREKLEAHDKDSTDN